jgi:acyl dehydratase
MKVIYLEDLSVGDSWESSEHVVDGAEMLAYNQQNDPWPMHVVKWTLSRGPLCQVS